MDTVKVELYRQVGSSPDPGVDVLLGTDTDFPGGGWDIPTAGWGEGRYTIYAVGYDLAGNRSSFTSRKIGVLPDPMRVSGLVSWQVGELNNVRIGQFNL